MASPRRILYVSAVSEIGGAEESLLTLLSALDRTAFQPLLALPEGGESALGHCAVKMGVECVAVPLQNLTRTLNPLRLVSSWLRLRTCQKAISDIVRALRIDIIHANSTTAALQAAGAPLICHLRDLRLPRLAAAALRSKCRMFIAVSQAVSAFAGQRLARPVRCIPNGVDIERFRPAIGNAGPKRPYLLMAAHLAPWKRHDIFIECLAWLRSRDASLTGIVAGDDLFSRHRQYRERLRCLADDLGLHYALEWAGAVPREKMPSLFSSAAAVVHPAVEPFGRAILEAMACATPVVAADAGGGRELLTNSGGMLVTPGDVAGFTAAIWRYLTDPALAREHGAAGRRIVCEHYSAQRHAQRIEAVYREMCGAPRAKEASEATAAADDF